MSINDDIGIDFDYKKGTKRVRNPSGALLIDDKHVADTLQCKHCGGHWIVVKGSKKQRGWCFRCFGPLCGKQECLMSCKPSEAQLEENEKNYEFENGIYIKNDIR